VSLRIKSFKEIIELICALIFRVLLPLIREGSPRIVIYYHGIKKKDIRQFEKQMAYLAKKCVVVNASHIKTVPSYGKKPIVAITFDDAFVSVLDNAMPVLEKHGFPATICVPVGNLGKSPQWEMENGCLDRDEHVMTEEQILEIDRKGFELFSHGVSHPPLCQVPDKEISFELSESKKRLEQIVGHEIVGISYPHGAYDNRVIKAAQETGYQLGFTIQPSSADMATNDLEVGRTCVSPDDSPIRFKLKVHGAYEAVTFLRSCKQSILRPQRRLHAE
jgi:peptidoglycan/xylan/chitin deacetylase (PgdA/CDA1 family)